jgi:hypothetical protein
MNTIFPNWLRLWFVFLCLTRAYGYDGQLESFYSAASIDSEKFTTHVSTLKIEDLDLNQVPFFIKSPRTLLFVGGEDGKLSPFRVVCASYRGSFSLKTDETGRDRLGLYFVTKLARFPPFLKAFSEPDKKLFGWVSTYPGPPYRGCATQGEAELSLLNKANLSILELYDAAFSFEQLDHLAKFETLEILGLPRRGLKFSGPFDFPKNLKHLVVRNTELTSRFFEALHKLSGLEKLVILECTTSLGEPISFEGGYDRKNSWRDTQGIFKSTAKPLQSMIIKESDPLIFDYLIPETWRSLKHLEADLFLPMEGLRTTLITKENFRSIFPSLETLNLCVLSGSNQEETERMCKNLVNQDRKIIIRLSQYPSREPISTMP